MSFGEHCEGHRFDRARVLRGRGRPVDAALARAIETVKALEIPHLEFEEVFAGIVH